MFCPNCGNECPEGDLFCGLCGCRIAEVRALVSDLDETVAASPIAAATGGYYSGGGALEDVINGFSAIATVQADPTRMILSLCCASAYNVCFGLALKDYS